jgi:biotin synthase-like enzyme
MITAARAKAAVLSHFCMGAARARAHTHTHTHRQGGGRARASASARICALARTCGSIYLKEGGNKGVLIYARNEKEVMVRHICFAPAPVGRRVRRCVGEGQVGKGQWERVLEMVKRIRALDMEVCTTLGMLTPDQAMQLRQAGLTAYNHNLDTSPEFYPKVTSTRKYEVRCATSDGIMPLPIFLRKVM